MEGTKIRTRIANGRQLHLRDLPFPAGQEVEVTLTAADGQQQQQADFWRGPSIDELAARAAAKPVSDLESLVGSWPTGENVDEFLAARNQWRHEDIESQK